MTKTAIEIERDFFNFAKASALGAALQGSVYYAEMRPANAKTEDMVVKLLAGSDEQIQSGIVIFNIYVPDIAHGNNGRKVENRPRVAQLMTLVNDFIANGGSVEYLLKADATPKSSQAEGIEQHIITARIHFQRTTF